MRAYTADMIPGGASPVINVSQYDNDYAVTVTLIEGAEIYTPPSGATIMVEGTKPDGNGFSYACTYQGNVVTVPIYTQMTAVAGRFPIELVVYQSGLRVGSCNITLAVERAPLDSDEIISDSDIPAIIALAQAQADAAASSAASAETAKTAAMDAAQDAIDAAQELQTAIQFNAALIHETVSGAVASFADGADNIPMQSLIAEITPVQSGSGDPSPTNIRPISGRTGMTVTRAGKNLLENNWGGESRTQSGISISVGNDGVITANGTATASGVIIANFGVANSSTATQNWRKRALPNGTYRFVGTGDRFNLQVRGTNEEAGNADTSLAASNVSNTFTIDDSYKYNWVRLQFSNGTTATNRELSLMIVPVGITDDTYEPYTGTSIPITWESIAGTVYGGTLDVVSGVLTVDKGFITLDGTQTIANRNWKPTADSVGWLYPYAMTQNVVPASSAEVPTITSNRMKAVSYSAMFNGTENNCIGLVYDTSKTYGLAVRYADTSLTTDAAINAFLAENPIQVVFLLETPQTYQLTPTEVRTILGGNTIYTDAGDVSVEYIADTKLYIDNKIAELQALVLEN